MSVVPNRSRVRFGAALLLFCSIGASPSIAKNLSGQIVFAPCWLRTDRATTPYGTREDLNCAIESAKKGIGPSLAVSGEEGFELYTIQGDPPGGGPWLEWVGRFVRAEALIERNEDETRVRLVSLETVAPPAGALPVGQDEGDGRVEMTWIDLDGRSTKLGDGERIVVVNFWATWCQPCVEEWPDLIRLNDKFAPHGVEFIGAAADKPDQTKAVIDYVKQFEIDFRIVLGATPQQMQSVGLRPALPATVVLSERGHPFVRFQHVINPDRLDAALSGMLGIPESE